MLLSESISPGFAYGWSVDDALTRTARIVEAAIARVQRRDQLVTHLASEGRGYELAVVEALKTHLRASGILRQQGVPTGQACFAQEHIETRKLRGGKRQIRRSDFLVRPAAQAPVVAWEVKAFHAKSGGGGTLAGKASRDLERLRAVCSRRGAAFGVLVVFTLGLPPEKLEEAIAKAVGRRAYKRRELKLCGGMRGVLLAVDR
jgi:hypothetical protein